MAIEILGNIGVDTSGNAKMKRTASYSFCNYGTGKIIKSSAGRLKGIFVSAATNTPLLKLWDNIIAATNDLVDTFTPSANTMYNFGCDIEFGVGLYVEIGGSVKCTVFYE